MPYSCLYSLRIVELLESRDASNFGETKFRPRRRVESQLGENRRHETLHPDDVPNRAKLPGAGMKLNGVTEESEAAVSAIQGTRKASTRSSASSGSASHVSAHVDERVPGERSWIS
jgi:hypothetical protein